MKKLIGIALALALGGCTTLKLATGSDVSPSDVYIAANSFDAAQTLGATYLKFPPCSATVIVACRSTTGVAAVVSAVRAGRKARIALEAYVTANPGQLVPVSNYNTLVTAINTIQAFAAANGVSK